MTGIELSKNSREVTWSPKQPQQQPEADNEDSYRDEGWRQRLNITMATLGKGVSKTEEQIVEVETLNADHTALRIPLVNMVSSHQNTILTKATFSDLATVSFRLISGDGPIYLSGCVEENLDDDSDSLSSWSDDDSDDASEDDDSDDSTSEADIEPKDSGKAGCKRKFPKSKDQKKGGKVAKGKRRVTALGLPFPISSQCS
ncbi:hypothetical protein ACOMHN_029183 [Nucella lapillus]